MDSIEFKCHGKLGNDGYKEVMKGLSCVGVEHVLKDPPLAFRFVTYLHIVVLTYILRTRFC
jgi:hypothetical protein